MAWSDVFRGAKDYLDRMRGRGASPSEPEPPPRYYRGAPPPPPDYRAGPPPYQFNVDLYNQVINAASRAADPNASDWQGYANIQALLNLAYPILLEPIPEPYRSQLQGAIRGLERWIESYRRKSQQAPEPQGEPKESVAEAWESEEGMAARVPSEYPVSNIQNWPEEYREDIAEEAIVTKTPGSSNVYSFVWVNDEHTIDEDGGISINLYGQRSTNMGTLIVTFKVWTPGMKQKERPNSPGATYAYAGVSRMKYEAFLGSTSPESAGYAVWDYLRIRGTQSGHQHAYRLVSVTGDYVPRMATPTGFRRRSQRMLVVDPNATGDEAAWVKARMQSTLRPGPLTRFGQAVDEEQARGFSGSEWSFQAYKRRSNRGGYPNRGTPNRGTPNSGRP